MTLAARLAALIAQDGPLSIAPYMAACLHDPIDGYYAARPGLGRDFTTAPEISQMFGELLGLWCVQSWLECGAPDPVSVIELGPGRGTLMADCWRAWRAAPALRAAARIALVETSEPLRETQARTLAAVGATARVHATLDDALDEAAGGPCLILGNEFLDCLPIRQFVRVGEGWRERLVGLDKAGALTFGLGGALGDAAALPGGARAAPEGAVAEIRPGLEALVGALARGLAAAPGRALFLDYGSAQSAPGDTLQAIRGGVKVHPLAFPGESDLTAHVDFEAFGVMARAHGLSVHGAIAQGTFLEALGLGARAAALAAAQPHQAAAIFAARERLSGEAGMGTLFQAICVSAPGLPVPAGFAP